MKIILIIAICLLVVVTIIVVWGVITKWKFKCTKKDNYKKNSTTVLTKQQYNKNTHMKLLVLIFSCKKYLSRIDKLKNIGYLDYFNKQNIDYLIVIGNEKINDEYILQKQYYHCKS